MKLSNQDLLAIIRSHRDDSLGAEDGDLSNQRAEAMNHYHGRPYGNEVAGRSQIVSRDLAEAVDWALPAVVRAFVQTGNIAEFAPIGPEDEQLAQQETDYVNHVIMRDNAGFMVIHDLAKDAMLLKNCYVKHYWEDKEETTEESYTGLTMEQIVKMVQDLEAYGAKVEIKEQDSRFIAVPGMPQEMNQAQQIMAGPAQIELFDIKLAVTKKCGKVVVEAVPPEEVRVSKRCRGSLQTSPFVEHVTRKTRSELVEMGMSKDFVYSLPSFNERDNNTQQYARDSVDDESDSVGSSFNDRSMDEIEFCESYVLVDADGDGIAERRKIVTVADRIPEGDDWNEVIAAVPMSGGVIKRVPHRHVGESLDDELADLQEIQTALKRQLNDNVYLTNNSEKVVNERVNLRDFMTSTPGGIKRVRGDGPVGDAVMPLVAAPIIDKLLPVIDYWDKKKETRSGIRPGSDMDPDMLKEVTKGAFMEHLNRASQKIEMITRLFAETVVKEMVMQVHGLLIRHQDQQKMVQLRGKWVPVNPQEWKQRTDLTVKVGLGTGNEEEKRQKLMMMFQMQQQVLQAVSAPPPVYAKVYEMFSELAKTMGFDMPEKFAIAPGSPEHQQVQQAQSQQPNPEMMKVQVQQQIEQARLQGQQQMEQARMQMQQQTDQMRQEWEARQQQAKLQMEMELARAKADLEIQLQREKAQLQAQVQIEIARINAASRIDAAQLTAQTTLTPEQESASDGAVQD